MKAEYAKIVDGISLFRSISKQSKEYSAMLDVAERCEALANKPVRELTDGEIWLEHRVLFGYAASNDDVKFARAIISAHIAKQPEPDEIPFDQAKLDEGGWKLKILYKDSTHHSFSEESVSKVTLVRKT